jgi:hypothetical protein
MKKISFTKNPAPTNKKDSIRKGIPRVFLYFCSTERNSELFSFPRNRSEQNSKCFFYFCSTEWNSELFSLPRNGSERNSESLLLFCSIAHNSEHFSTLRNCSERNFESLLFRGTAGIPPEQTNCFVYSVFRVIIFLSEIANPSIPSSAPPLMPISVSGGQAG